MPGDNISRFNSVFLETPGVAMPGGNTSSYSKCLRK